MPKPTSMELEDINRLEEKSRSLLNGKRGDLDVISEVLGQIGIYWSLILKKGVVSCEECENSHRDLVAALNTPLAQETTWKAWVQNNGVKLAAIGALVLVVAMATGSPIADVFAEWLGKVAAKSGS